MMRHCIRPSAAATSGFPQKSSIVKRDATTQEKTRQGYPVHVVDNAVGSSRERGMKAQKIAVWIAVGIGVGVAIGAATHAMALSICIGIVAGAAIGAAVGRR
jgi:hypothetical protein